MNYGVNTYGSSQLNATNISSSSTTTAMTGLSVFSHVAISIVVSAVPTGTTMTLDCYVQTSFDGGTTWVDLAHTQFTTATGSKLVLLQRSPDSLRREAYPAPRPPASDGALAGETVLRYQWGDQIRIKYVFAAGDSSGTYTMNSDITAG
jgi:hypothetical protein